MGLVKNYPIDTVVNDNDILFGTDSAVASQPQKGFYVYKLYEGYDSWKGNITVTLTDFTDTTHYYYGGTFGDDNWIITRYLKTNLVDKGKAYEVSNPNLYLNIDEAWVDRLTLNYNN